MLFALWISRIMRISRRAYVPSIRARERALVRMCIPHISMLLRIMYCSQQYRRYAPACGVCVVPMVCDVSAQ